MLHASNSISSISIINESAIEYQGKWNLFWFIKIDFHLKFTVNFKLFETHKMINNVKFIVMTHKYLYRDLKREIVTYVRFIHSFPHHTSPHIIIIYPDTFIHSLSLGCIIHIYCIVWYASEREGEKKHFSHINKWIVRV